MSATILKYLHTFWCTEQTPPSVVPSEMLSDSKCNEFASVFSEMISNVRKVIGTSSYAEVTIRPQF